MSCELPSVEVSSQPTQRPQVRTSELEALGYKGCRAILDASDWVPQRRARAWFAFFRTGEGSPERVLQLALQLRPSVAPTIRSLRLLPPVDTKQKVTTPKSCFRKLKWPSHTLSFIKAHELKPGRLARCKEALHQCADFPTLTLREQQLLIAMYAYLQQRQGIDPSQSTVVLDISQSVLRTPWAVNKSPCLTPSSKLWISKPGALLKAFDHAVLQGVPEAACPDTAARLLRDLVGNAFCGPVAGAVLLGAFVAISEVNGRRR